MFHYSTDSIFNLEKSLTHVHDIGKKLAKEKLLFPLVDN